ncbi:MAG TPA: hypothetical protein VK660_10870, partial [Xanthomonadaceae bacterium]|nr:hypothetical protein [Xanthomonadaceae bacterium]
LQVKFHEAVEPTGTGWWCAQVLPPLAILALEYVPLDLGTSNQRRLSNPEHFLWTHTCCGGKHRSFDRPH